MQSDKKPTAKTIGFSIYAKRLKRVIAVNGIGVNPKSL
jgi:hypothetical protein